MKRLRYVFVSILGLLMFSRNYVFPQTKFADFEEQLIIREFIFGNIGIGYGARALGMGGAFIGLADDVTAINYNPAGLAQLVKTEFTIGGSLGEFHTSIQGVEGLGQTPSWWGASLSPVDINMKRRSLDYAGGLVPFKIAGIPVAFAAAFQNKVINNTNVETLRTNQYWELYENPDVSGLEDIVTQLNNTGGINVITVSLATRPLGFLHIGASLNIFKDSRQENIWQQQTLTYYQDQSEIGSSSKLYESSENYLSRNGIGVDVGILIKGGILSVGAVYKSGLSMGFSYTGLFRDRNVNSDGQIFSAEYTDSHLGKLKWPSYIGAGITLRPIEPVTFSIDWNLTNWNKAKIMWDENYEWSYPIRNVENRHQIRLGFEYLLTFRKISIPLRFGAYTDTLLGRLGEGVYDKGHNTYSITTGTGFVLDKLSVEFAGLYNFGYYGVLRGDVWDDEYGGIYVEQNVKSWKVVSSISYRF